MSLRYGACHADYVPEALVDSSMPEFLERGDMQPRQLLVAQLRAHELRSFGLPIKACTVAKHWLSKMIDMRGRSREEVNLPERGSPPFNRPESSLPFSVSINPRTYGFGRGDAVPGVFAHEVDVW